MPVRKSAHPVAIFHLTGMGTGVLAVVHRDGDEAAMKYRWATGLRWCRRMPGTPIVAYAPGERRK
jgi:hypothetical protein